MDKITRDNILYGASVIEYEIEYAQRKTLNISVNPDGTVYLKAPADATLQQIRQMIHKRANWILRQKRFFESFGVPTTERQYVSGESHLYLGRQYMLRVKKSDVNEVHYQNNIIEIECRHKKDVGSLLQTWYRRRADIKFMEYAKPIIKQFSAYGVKPKSISIKTMNKRWGYCTADGHITLNPRLICAPRCCIEYVITHEMCHLICRNHNKDFYALLSKEMPHWEKWKNKLERIMM
ncbi:MAG: M48 family metallopeptidase [Paludibacteraceae bacterium]|nr:M48 family metallopeptidase [Paludibacteraceae bacterium]